MADFLVLQMEGPLMSFGDVAIDETRPTALLPSQSMLTGLLANAMGWSAPEGERLNRLQERLVLGARRDRTGERLVDYQNAHIGHQTSLWRTRTPGPLERKGGGGDNVQRWRHYIADGSVSIALTLVPAEESPTLDDISRALRHPARPLFLGRMSCPPTTFLHTGTRIKADTVREALQAIPLQPQTEAWAQWPAHGPLGSLDGGTLEERFDLRDWQADIHAGCRLVVNGYISPQANTQQEV